MNFDRNYSIRPTGKHLFHCNFTQFSPLPPRSFQLTFSFVNV